MVHKLNYIFLIFFVFFVLWMKFKLKTWKGCVNTWIVRMIHQFFSLFNIIRSNVVDAFVSVSCHTNREHAAMLLYSMIELCTNDWNKTQNCQCSNLDIYEHQYQAEQRILSIDVNCNLCSLYYFFSGFLFMIIIVFCACSSYWYLAIWP